MKFLITNKDLFRKRKFIFFIFFLLLAFQLIYSFLFPAVGYTGTGHGWLSFQDLIRHQKSPLDVSDASIIDKFSPLFSKYRVNADGAVYLILAKNFPEYYFENNIFLSRPLYSFFVAVVAFFPRLFFDSYATFFVSAIFLNFILAFATILLFYFLVKNLISPRVAFLSSFLLIFSPFFHIWLVQPLPEILGTFMVITSLYFIYNYIKKPSYLKLVIFSLIIGTFMLAKMFFAISIFILLLAVYFKRYKEGLLFAVIHLIPLGVWYLFVTKILGIGYYVNEASTFNIGIWLFNIFYWPWQKTAEIFLAVLPRFFSSVIYGFLLIPVIFAAAGFKNLSLPNKNLLCSSFIFSFLTLFFIMNYYIPRHGFLLFPIIYPLTVLGIDRVADFLKRYKVWYSVAFYVVAIASFVIISSVNIYKVVDY